MNRDGIGCWFQYDEDEKPCMVFYLMAAAKQGQTPPVCVAHLDNLWKYADDGYLWRSTKEWTEILRGHYGRYEHRNLYFFVNDCLSYLLLIKPFPEQLRPEAPQIDVVQVDDKRFHLTAH